MDAGDVTAPAPSELEERRKSLGLMRDISTSWSAEPPPQPVKYTLNEEEGACGGFNTNDFNKIETENLNAVETASKIATKNDDKTKENEVSPENPPVSQLPPLPPPLPPPPKMSCMEEESIRERLRIQLLRQCAEILDAESKYTRENFRRAFLNKVGQIYVFINTCMLV